MGWREMVCGLLRLVLSWVAFASPLRRSATMFKTGYAPFGILLGLVHPTKFGMEKIKLASFVTCKGILPNGFTEFGPAQEVFVSFMFLSAGLVLNILVGMMGLFCCGRFIRNFFTWISDLLIVIGCIALHFAACGTSWTRVGVTALVLLLFLNVLSRRGWFNTARREPAPGLKRD
jgi:hypothetical protein